jgi:hypothetical protein
MITIAGGIFFAIYGGRIADKWEKWRGSRVGRRRGAAIRTYKLAMYYGRYPGAAVGFVGSAVLRGLALTGLAVIAAIVLFSESQYLTTPPNWVIFPASLEVRRIVAILIFAGLINAYSSIIAYLSIFPRALSDPQRYAKQLIARWGDDIVPELERAAAEARQAKIAPSNDDVYAKEFDKWAQTKDDAGS